MLRKRSHDINAAPDVGRSARSSVSPPTGSCTTPFVAWWTRLRILQVLVPVCSPHPRNLPIVPRSHTRPPTPPSSRWRYHGYGIRLGSLDIGKNHEDVRFPEDVSPA